MSLHAYLMLNAAIAIGYLLSRFILTLPAFKKSLLQSQRLQFARHAFLFSIISFIFIAYALPFFPSAYHSNFQLEPILKTASVMFFDTHPLVNEKITTTNTAPFSLSMNIAVSIVFALGFAICFFKYVNNLIVLKKIRQTAFCQHTINGVHLLFSKQVNLPFCWSRVKKHFIVIPNAMLEISNDLKLALRHELQHIRQGDTHWLQILMLLKLVCFWNPFMKLWINWLLELQEFSCDESLILRKKTSPVDYAQCLIDAASNSFRKDTLPQGALGIHGVSTSVLKRRVTMLFNYSKIKSRKNASVLVYILSFLMSISVAYALNGSSSTAPLTAQQVTALIKKSNINPSFQVKATPEVVTELNNIRSSEKARFFMKSSLLRMKAYQPVIENLLKEKEMPKDLLAVPLVESGYKPLTQNETPMQTAGIWQFIPATAKTHGLMVSKERDDRLDTPLSTKAALSFLHSNYEQFGDWKLAFVAYEIGEQHTQHLITTTGSHDAWTLARSSAAPVSLKKTLAMFDATLIIMHNPSLVS